MRKEMFYKKIVEIVPDSEFITAGIIDTTRKEMLNEFMDDVVFEDKPVKIEFIESILSRNELEQQIWFFKKYEKDGQYYYKNELKTRKEIFDICRRNTRSIVLHVIIYDK